MTKKIGNKIGEGACAEVFEWEDQSKIVKVAKPNTSTRALQEELHHCRIAWECGLPVPKPFEQVNIEGRFGIVFERILGETFLKRFIDGAVKQSQLNLPIHVSENYSDVRMTARLLYQIHTHSVPDMPSQRDYIKHDIRLASYLTEVEKAAVIALLDQLPLKHQLCHGDPNPANILLRDNDAVVVDWSNATTGNPEADLAEYIVMIRYAILPSDWPNEVSVVLNATRETIIRIFMEEYEKLSGIGYADIEPWIAPIAARKLSADAMSLEEKHLLVKEIRRRLHCN